jgi:hypothetical protein
MYFCSKIVIAFHGLWHEVGVTRARDNGRIQCQESMGLTAHTQSKYLLLDFMCGIAGC